MENNLYLVCYRTFIRYKNIKDRSWEHYYLGENLFDIAKQKIITKTIDEKFLFFFIYNYSMQTCISTSLKGILERIFPAGYILNNHSFEKKSYRDILPPISDELKIHIIFALDDLMISYKEKSFLSTDNFSEKTLNIPKGNIVLLRFDLWYRILSSPSFIIADCSSL